MSVFDAFMGRTETPPARGGFNLAPTFTNQPKNMESFRRKWNEIGPEAARRVGMGTTKRIYEMDKRRVQAGVDTYTRPETARMLAAAFKREPITEAPNDSLNPIQTIPRDVSGLLTGLIHLPQAAWNAVSNPMESVDAVAEGLKTGDYQKVASAPLMAFVPGMYTAANVLEGDFEEIARHPVSTVLDVLPAATKLASMTDAAKYATQTAEAHVPLPGVPGEKVRPIRAALTKKVREIPIEHEGKPVILDNGQPATTKALMNNLAGDALDRMGETAFAQFFRPKFGSDAKWMAQFGRRREAIIGETALSESPIPDEMNYRTNSRGEFIPNHKGERIYHGLGDNLRKAGVELDKKWNLTPEEKVQAVEAGKNRNVYDPAYQALPDNIRGYLDEVKEITDQYVRMTAPPITALMSKFQGRWPDYIPGLEINAMFRNEVYGAKQAKILADLEEGAQRAHFKAVGLRTRMAQLANLPGADERLMVIHDLLAKGDSKSLSQASQLWNDMGARRINPGRSSQKAYDDAPMTVAPDDVPGGLISMDEASNIKVILANATKAAGKFDRAMFTNIPAKWSDWVIDRANLAAEAKIRSKWGDTAGDEAARLFAERNYAPLIDEGKITQKEFNSLVYDAATGIRAAQDLGIDPIFIHHTAPSQLRGMQWPRVLAKEFTPSIAKERIQSMQPYVRDYSLALTHQGIELASKLAQEDFVDAMLTRYGTKSSVLWEKYKGRGKGYRDAHPQIMDPHALEDMIGTAWVKWDPKSFFGYESKRFVDLYGNDIWLPRHVMKVLDEMKKPVHEPGAIGSLWDPVMGLYRASVLTFSPRWQLNNMLGGYIMLSATTDPLTAFRYFRDARKLMKGEEVTLRGQKVHTPSEFRASLGQMRREMKELNFAQLGAGNTLSRWFHQSFLSGSAERLAQITGKPFTTVADASRWLNTFFDDMYRSMAYLYGYDKSITKGMKKFGHVPDEANSARAGMALVNKILPQWDALTPFERGILRSVFPFYTWTQHILRYAYNLPLDHPYRVAVTAGLLRNEQSDEATGWPNLFRSMILIGQDDDEKTAIKLGAANPFSDVGNMMTLEGFMGSMNPVLTTLAETRGIGRSGFADLFPDMDYDPSKGTLVPSTGNPLTNLLHNTIPQTEALGTLLRRTQEFDADMVKNPDKAQERIMQGFGIPLYWDKISLAEEAAKRELALYQAQEADKAEGLKKGDMGEIDKWPGNREYSAQVRQAQDLRQLIPFQPGT